ncbi:MAG: antibiotic biosynthesis monooxygenase [Dehalococcoidia bacterium]
MTAVPASTQTVTLVTQTRVLPGKDAEFATWQQRMNDAIAAQSGFLDHQVMAPAPPTQLDWVIVQRFRSMDAVQAWLRSSERQQLLAEIEPVLAGHDDIHLFTSDSARPADSSASAVISTRVAPDQEQAFRNWQRRIAAAEATFPGFQGHKLEPPIPGVQEDWATVVRFDSDEHLQAWLTSPRRQQLLDEAASFGADSYVRTMRGGFEGWFDFGGRSAALPPAWKQNMVVLLVLYPIVFLFGAWVQTPLLVDRGMPFWLALFISNAVSVNLTGYLCIPWAIRRLKWWLAPGAGAPAWTNAAGAALVVVLYGVALAIFAQFP